MPTNTQRTTAYLTEGEKAGLRLLARYFGTSENGVIKILIRDRVGLSLPDRYEYLLAELSRSGLPHGQSRV